MPLQLCIWIGKYIPQNYDCNLVNANPLTTMNGLSNNLLESLTACEQILETPVSSAYSSPVSSYPFSMFRNVLCH